jgi:hypothetical protein
MSQPSTVQLAAYPLALRDVLEGQRTSRTMCATEAIALRVRLVKHIAGSSINVRPA